MTSDLGDYLDDVLKALWPGRTAEFRSGARRAQPTDKVLVPVPGANRPRLIVPARPHRVAAAAMSGFNTSATGVHRLRYQVAARAIRLGILELAPRRLVLSGTDPGVDDHLSDVLGRAVQVALYLGPRRAVQKPVLQVIDAAGGIVGFAKIGMTPRTRRLVRHEAETLQRVHDASPSVFVAPDILHSGTWHGHEVLVQRALPAGCSDDDVDRLLPSATAELGRLLGVTREPWLTSGYRTTLQRRLEDQHTHPQWDLLAALIARCDSALAEVVVDFGCSHGDWTPWNMTAACDQLAVWDWEHFSASVPVGLDAVHYELSRRVVQQRQPVVEAFAALAVCRPLALGAASVDGPRTSHLLLLYVAEILARYLEDDEVREGGTRMSRVQEWVPPVLAAIDRTTSTGSR